MTNDRRQTIARIVILVLVVALTIYLFTLPEEQVQQLAGYGYGGIFLLSILANATILLPAPGLLFVFTMGARFQPLQIALAAGAGATIGELSGYLAGYSGQNIVDDIKMYDRMVDWMDRHGALTVMVLAFIPNPLFDLAGVAAGALKMPVWQFMIWAFIGKFFKMLITALAGAGLFSLPWLNNLFIP